MAELRKSIMHFARENFGAEYHPVLHGRCSSLECLTLLIKPRGMNPFVKQKMIVLSSVGRYAVDPDGFSSLRKSFIKTSKRSLEKEEISSVFDAHDVGVEILDRFGMDVQMASSRGDLKLGQLDEEFFQDADVREILSSTTLKPQLMEPYKSCKLYLATGIVYSKKFKLVGERNQRFRVDAHVASPESGMLHVVNGKGNAMSANYSDLHALGAPLTRKSRAPLLFTLTRVHYNSEGRVLELPKGAFIGKRVRRTRGLNIFNGLDVSADSESSVAAISVLQTCTIVTITEDDDVLEGPVELSDEDIY